MASRTFAIDAPAPFRLDLTVWALRRRAHNAVDSWDGRSWRRTLAAEGQPIGVSVLQTGTPAKPRLAVELAREGAPVGDALVAKVRQLLQRILGLDRDLGGFYRLAAPDERLSQLAMPFVGMRPPVFPSVFEAAVNAIACQQLSLEVGIHVLNRLAGRYGPTSPSAPPGFPSGEGLAEADPTELRGLGLSGAKARALVALACGVASGELDLEGLPGASDHQARAVLGGLSGIGRWSTEYVLLRGLGRLEVLPGDDVGARNHLRRRFGLDEAAGYEEVAALAHQWWPYGGLVYLHLLLDGLAAGGRLADASSVAGTRG